MFRVGEITQGSTMLYSRSPLSEPEFVVFDFCVDSDDGEIHRRGCRNINSRSPLYEPESLVFDPNLRLIDFVHFDGLPFMSWAVWPVNIS